LRIDCHIDCHAKFKMAEVKMAKDRNIGRDNAKKFLEYAAECRRMARTASEADRAVLMQIAEAWIVCAEEAEGKAGA
jgi:hypothetical protein